jgi:hypothetical protein
MENTELSWKTLNSVVDKRLLPGYLPMEVRDDRLPFVAHVQHLHTLLMMFQSSSSSLDTLADKTTGGAILLRDYPVYQSQEGEMGYFICLDGKCIVQR